MNLYICKIKFEYYYYHIKLHKIIGMRFVNVLFKLNFVS